MQLDQVSGDEIVARLAEYAFGLPDVHEAPTRISIPGARAMVLDPKLVTVPEIAMFGGEFGHIHPEPELGSMHCNIHPEIAEKLIARGWGEFHPLVATGQMPPSLVMIFAPRDEADLKVICWLVKTAHAYAQGRDVPAFP